MAETTPFPTAESVQAQPGPVTTPSASESAPVSTDNYAPSEPRVDQHRWEDEGGSNAQIQPPATGAVEPTFMDQALAYVVDHPVLASAAAAAAGALLVAALAGTGSRSVPVAPASRRSRRYRQALLDEVHDTTQAILRALNVRTTP